MIVSTTEDRFVRDYWECNPRWIVQLNNNEVVYQDDGRPNLPHNSWLRLKEYCEYNDLYITYMHIQFRSNKKELPRDMDGYSFSYGVRGEFGADSVTKLFFTGYLSKGILTVSKWRVPEMILESTQVRSIDTVKDTLIQKL